MCLHTHQVFSFKALGFGDNHSAEPFFKHVLTFLNPLSAVLGQWMETIDREICAVLELKRVSDRRRLECARTERTLRRSGSGESASGERKLLVRLSIQFSVKFHEASPQSDLVP